MSSRPTSIPQSEIRSAIEETRIGVNELPEFKGQYFKIPEVILEAVQTLPAPRDNLASFVKYRGVAKAFHHFQQRLGETRARLENERTTPLLEMSSTSPPPAVQNQEQQRNYQTLQADDEETQHEACSASRSGFEDSFANEILRIHELSEEKFGAICKMIDLAEATSRSASFSDKDSFREELKNIYRMLNRLAEYISANETIATRILNTPFVVDSRFGPRIRYALLRETKSLLHDTLQKVIQSKQRTEVIFGDYFCAGNSNLAAYELIAFVDKSVLEQVPTWLFVYFGAVLSLLAVTLLFLFLSPTYGIHKLDEAGLLKLYRGLSTYPIYFWCKYLLIQVFRGARVNYAVLLEMSTQSKKNNQVNVVLRKANNLTLLFLTSLALGVYFIYTRNVFMANLCPTLLLGIFTLHFLWYFKFEDVSPWYLIGISPHTFYIVLATDILTSTAKPLGDLSRLICHVTHPGRFDQVETVCMDSYTLNAIIIPFLHAYPLFLRMVQNLRQSYLNGGKIWPFFVNALKYAFAHQVVIISTFRMSSVYESDLLFFFFIISSIFAYAWDIFMDFGLGRCEYNGLRSRLMYKNPALYYTAIIGDFVLRFTWALTLFSPNKFNLLVDNLIYFVELFRRAAWTAFRVENEHLNNTIGYRTVDFVPLYFYEEEDKELAAEQDLPPPTSKATTLKLFMTGFAVIFLALYTLHSS